MKNLFRKLEDWFLEGCIQNCREWQVDQSPVEWSNHMEYVLATQWRYLLATIASMRPEIRQIEASYYYIYKPAVREEELKTRFIAMYFPEPTSGDIEAEFWSKHGNYPEMRKGLAQHWNESMERKIFVVCLEVYKVFIERLLMALLADDDVIDPIQSKVASTPLSKIFHSQELYSQFIKCSIDVDNLDSSLRWIGRGSLYIKALLHRFYWAKVFTIDNDLAIARALVETFSVKLSPNTLRRFRKAKPDIDMKRLVDTHYGSILKPDPTSPTNI
jgi:hypothetical protein